MTFYETDQMFQWVCDKCGLSAEFPPNDFWRCWGELKARGWRAIKSADEGFGHSWSHRCAVCTRKFAESVLDEPYPLRKVKG
jgi:hypothetical protein